MREQLAQGLLPESARAGIEPAAFQSQAQHPNRYATRLR